MDGQCAQPAALRAPLRAARCRRGHRRHRVSRGRSVGIGFQRNGLRHQFRHADRRPRTRSRAASRRPGVVCRGNAEELAFPNNAFDAYTIAFGIRNVPRIDRALGEAFRVLRPGGRFLCLEFSTVDVPGLDRIYDLFSFKVIPPLGRAVTGDGESYEYLVESIRKFPKPGGFAETMMSAGFSRVSWQSF